MSRKISDAGQQRAIDATALGDPNVVEALRDLLARAEVGEIVSVAWGATRMSGAIEYGHATSPESNVWQLMGAVAGLQHRLLVKYGEGED